MSPLLLRAIGVFVPFMRELSEMAYQWQAPFVIDDGRFRARFGFGALRSCSARHLIGQGRFV